MPPKFLTRQLLFTFCKGCPSSQAGNTITGASGALAANACSSHRWGLRYPSQARAQLESQGLHRRLL